jgi:hypothetical protein
MGVDDLRRLLSGLRLVALDTMVFVYHLADHPRYSALTTAVLEAIESGQVAGLTTTVTLAEILTAPAKTGDRRALQDCELYLTRFPNLKIVPLDVALAHETALVRGETGLCAPPTPSRSPPPASPAPTPSSPTTAAGPAGSSRRRWWCWRSM